MHDTYHQYMKNEKVDILMDFSDNINKIVPVTRFLLPTLSSSEKKAAEFLLADPQMITKITLIDFAQQSGSSQASIIRLCRRIGVSGFAELKSMLAIQLATGDRYETELDNRSGKNLGSDMIKIINWVFEENIQILRDTFALATDDYNRAFEAILKAKRIGFFAIGDAMIPCQFAYFKFRRLGYDCYAEIDSDLQIISACNLGKGDVAISVSHTGNTRQVNSAMKIAQKNGAATIGITKRERSEMIKYCDIKLFTATPDVSVGQEVVARRVAEQAIMEALYFGVLQKLDPASRKKIQEASAAMKVNKN